jgi:rhodanese-related sulfurtransferase
MTHIAPRPTDVTISCHCAEMQRRAEAVVSLRLYRFIWLLSSPQHEAVVHELVE